MRRILTLGVVAAVLCGGYVSGDSNINPLRKVGWSENAGWLNFRDANSAVDGVAIHETYLEGYVWGENVGWIHLGGGPPNNCTSYANTNDTNFGVNLDAATGELSGMAWGENIGWVNFSGGSLATPAQPARIDVKNRRFRGYAWGEHVGWINLDDANRFPAGFHPADLDKDGDVDGNDFLTFSNSFNGSLSPPKHLP